MTVSVISWKIESESVPVMMYSGDWQDGWLGRRVSFLICGVEFTGTVVGTERHFLCNGTHDIVTVEIDGDPKQIKVQLHRQACRRI